jgi:hypothetical protein
VASKQHANASRAFIFFSALMELSTTVVSTLPTRGIMFMVFATMKHRPKQLKELKFAHTNG